MDTIAILDFGSQTTQLIARRIRELGVYSEIFPGTARVAELPAAELRGVVLSGSPWSVHDSDAGVPDPALYELDVPVLGICYGLQRMTYDLGGSVARANTREYGRARLRYAAEHPLFEHIPEGFIAWMSHGDSVQAPAEGWQVVARSEHGAPACIAEPKRRRVGIQFHPEVSHCEHGTRVLENFVFGICGAAAGWTVDEYLEQSMRAIRQTVGGDPVVLLISGGVDSSVVAALLLKALPPAQVHLIYVDTGLMRRNETAEVEHALRAFGAQHLSVVDASDRFLGQLAGVEDPEEKRRIIGDLFMTVQQQVVEERVPGEYYLAQGTLYTDMIESGKGVGASAKVIKSHHNVRSPLVEKKRGEGRIVEPLASLYKDEVRKLGAALGLPPSTIGRHPFPGPGLAVRIVGAVSPQKCDILRAADAIYIEELRARGLYDQIWQAFAVLLPVRAVGVAGDAREYGCVVALRAVHSVDGMTADVYPFESHDILEISARITNEVPAVGRVVYDVSSKPPATIEWE